MTSTNTITFQCVLNNMFLVVPIPIDCRKGWSASPVLHEGHGCISHITGHDCRHKSCQVMSLTLPRALSSFSRADLLFHASFMVLLVQVWYQITSGCFPCNSVKDKIHNKEGLFCCPTHRQRRGIIRLHRIHVWFCERNWKKGKGEECRGHRRALHSITCHVWGMTLYFHHENQTNA